MRVYHGEFIDVENLKEDVKSRCVSYVSDTLWQIAKRAWLDTADAL